MFLKKGILKICSKFTGEPMQSNFTEIALRHVCCPVNLLHVYGTRFPRKTSGWLLLIFLIQEKVFFSFFLSFLEITMSLMNVFSNATVIFLNRSYHRIDVTLHKKSSFPFRISSVNVTKSAGNCGFRHIY